MDERRVPNFTELHRCDVDAPSAGPVEETIGVIGELTVRHIRDGKVLHSETGRNLLVNTGLAQFARLVVGLSNLGAFYIQIGTGGVDPRNPNAILEPVTTNTALIEYYAEGETVRATRITNESGLPGSAGYVPFSVIARMAYTFDFKEPVRIPEAGLFTAPHQANPVMIAHRIFFPREMVAGDFLEFVWELGFSRYPVVR